MGYYDLRTFLAELKKEGQYVTYPHEVTLEPGVSQVGRASGRMGDDAPAVMIDRIQGCAGMRIAMNVHGSWPNHAIMLGMDRNATAREQFFEFAKRLDEGAEHGEIQWYDGTPPCRDVVVTEHINLYELIPIFRCNEYDGGCYLTKASVVTMDPEDPDNFDKVNVSTNRVQFYGPDTMGIQLLPFHDGARQFKAAERMGKPLPVSICLGVNPLISLMASAPLEYEQSEYKYAAAIGRTPLVLTKSLTSDVPVSAYSEYVIEGEMLPGVREPEGPFGEFPGSYSGTRNQVVIKVKAVTHRKNPIYESLYSGLPWAEHEYLIGLNTSVPIYRQLKAPFPEVTCVNALFHHGLTVVVAVDNRFGGFAKSVAMRVASTPHGISYAKNIILIDGNLDPFNPLDVMWALSCRVRPAKDVIVINNTPGFTLDPCSEPPGMGAKLIIDATTPVPPEAVMRETRQVMQLPHNDEFVKQLTDLHRQVKLH